MFRPSTRPEGISASDFEDPIPGDFTPTPGGDLSIPSRQPTPQPVPRLKGGATAWGGEVNRNVHASSEGPVQLPRAPAGAKLQFLSEGGQQIIARNAGLHDRVIVPGAWGESSIGAALNAGVIVQTVNGFEIADAEETKGTPASQSGEDAGDRADGQQDDQPADDPREFMPDSDEQEYASLEAKVGATTFAQCEALLADDQPIPDHIMSDVTAAFGGDREAAQQAIAQAGAAFIRHASEAVDQMLPGQGEAVFEFARGHAAEDLKGAMREHVNERSLQGYRDLATHYVVHLARTDPHAAADGLRRAGLEAVRVVRGEVVLDVPGAGECELVSSLKAGVLKLGR